MTSCFGCCGLCVVTAGHGAADAATNGAKVVGTAGTAVATESEPYRLFMCGWLGWLVHNVLCCCCCCYHGPRTDELAAAEAGSAPVVVSTAVAAPEGPSSPDGAAGAAKVGAEEAGGKGVGPLAGQQSDAAGVTTPLLALAV